MSNIDTAQREYFNRPADERFPSLDALVQHATHEKHHSTEMVRSIRDMKATTDGSTVMLTGPSGVAARLTPWAFGQFCRSVGAPASYLGGVLPPSLAVDCLNYGIGQTPSATDLNLLIRTPNGHPEPVIRAATSERYGRVWDADLYSAIADTLAGRDNWSIPPSWDNKPAGAYSGDRDSFLILCNGGSIVNDPTRAGGDDGAMFRGILVRNSEVGASSIMIDQVLFRYVCGNHMLWGAIVSKAFRRRHIGKNVTREVIREIGKIAFAWTHQSTERDSAILRTLANNRIAESEEALIDELRALGCTEKQAQDAYDTAKVTEPNADPLSYWAIANGMTRNSQQSEYQDSRYDLDKLAAVVMARGAKLVAA